MKIFAIADCHIDSKWWLNQKKCFNTIINHAKEKKPDYIIFAGDFFNRPLVAADKDFYSEILNIVYKLQLLSPIIMLQGTLSHDAPGCYEPLKKMGCIILCDHEDNYIYHDDKDTVFLGYSDYYKFDVKSYTMMSEKIIFIGHGVFVDNLIENYNNPIIKSTRYPVDNSELKKINADYYIFGHIHNPELFTSKIINGGYIGYMGYDNHPWGTTGFKPGFKIVEIKNKQFFKNTIYYPVKTKNKFIINYNDIEILKYKTWDFLRDTDCKIHLVDIKKEQLKDIDIDKLEKEFMKNCKCNSCIIEPKIKQDESIRINNKQYDKCKTLIDLYKIFDRNYSESIIQKITKIENDICKSKYIADEKVIDLISIEISGSIFSLAGQCKNKFFHNFKNDSPGLNAISGNNGKGKSTFIGFCSPYPVLIGFDYKTLKEFFPAEGYIKKVFTVNNEIHIHKIIIDKKINCYWTIKKETGMMSIINDSQKSEIAEIDFLNQKQFTLKEFMQECVKFFGPIDTFISTSFFSQEPWRMKKYASNLCQSSKSELRDAYINIVGINREEEKEYCKIKKDKIKSQIDSIKNECNSINYFLKNCENLKINYDKNVLHLDIVNKKLKELESKEDELKKIKSINDKLELQLNNLRNDYTDQQDLLAKEKNRISVIEKNINSLDRELFSFDKEIEILYKDITSFKKRIEILSKKCDKCGAIPFKQSIIEIELTKASIKEKYQKIERAKKIIKEKESEIENQELLKNIQNRNINYIKNKIDSLKEEAKEIKSKNVILEPNLIKNIISEIRKNEIEKTRIDTELKNIKENLDFVNTKKKEMLKLEKELKILDKEYDEWSSLYNIFSPDKLPGLELDLIAKEIDFLVNQKLKNFSITTRTQDVGCKNEIIDRFDIMVYDKRNFIEKSLIKHSVGERSWLNESISQVLREYRQLKTGVIFNWSFSDEQDSSIDFKSIQDYYIMVQNSLPEKHKRYVISHKVTEMTNIISNVINIEDIGK